VLDERTILENLQARYKYDQIYVSGHEIINYFTFLRSSEKTSVCSGTFTVRHNDAYFFTMVTERLSVSYKRENKHETFDLITVNRASVLFSLLRVIKEVNLVNL
jgi:hypothetical protein